MVEHLRTEDGAEPLYDEEVAREIARSFIIRPTSKYYQNSGEYDDWKARPWTERLLIRLGARQP